MYAEEEKAQRLAWKGKLKLKKVKVDTRGWAGKSERTWRAAYILGGP